MAEKYSVLYECQYNATAVASKGHFIIGYINRIPIRIRNPNRLLSENERVEIARMLSGVKLTDAALSNARELLRK
ncbi:MAG: hypothetical protein ACLTTW_05025 [Coprobacter sp.]